MNKKISDRMMYRQGGEIVFNSKIIQDELKQLGFDRTQIHEIRDIIVKSIKAATDKIQKNIIYQMII